MPDETPDERALRARAAREALIGKTIAGRYVLRGLLGHGGMGAVYEAEHLGLGKRAAIKFVDPEFATDEQVVARFAREARAMSAIESAHIVTVFDAGTEDGRPYLVMELLRGEDLGERLRQTTRVPLNEAMHVVAQVLKGLARAHAAGIIHRDLKPDNVFLTKHDTDPLFAKIVDFGISKIERPRAHTQPLALTGRGTVLGTPFYMSPEQAQASPDVDGRTDLYSVGAILFECLTGRPPHTGESYEQVILSICMREAPRVDAIEKSVPADVADFVARALTRDRAQRFPSAEAMLAALHEVAPEERSRVPLDPVAKTLGSPAVAPGAATLIDGSPNVRPSDPEVVAAKAPAAPDKAAGPVAVAKPKFAARAIAPAVVATKPAKKPLGTAMLTAALATLAGVGVTFAVISMLDTKPVDDGAGGISTTTSTVDAAAKVTSTVTSEAPSSGVAPSSSAAPSASTAPQRTSAPKGADAAPASTASTKPVTSGGARTPPRPTSTKPLDIQRDLP